MKKMRLVYSVTFRVIVGLILLVDTMIACSQRACVAGTLGLFLGFVAATYIFFNLFLPCQKYLEKRKKVVYICLPQVRQ
jgi:hypothetical protein